MSPPLLHHSRISFRFSFLTLLQTRRRMRGLVDIAARSEWPLAGSTWATAALLEPELLFLIRPVGLDEQRQGVLAQAVLHVVVQVWFLHAGERTLEAFVVEGFAPRPRDVVWLFGLAFFVFKAHLTVVLRHGAIRKTGFSQSWISEELVCFWLCVCLRTGLHWVCVLGWIVCVNF